MYSILPFLLPTAKNSNRVSNRHTLYPSTALFYTDFSSFHVQPSLNSVTVFATNKNSYSYLIVVFVGIFIFPRTRSSSVMRHLWFRPVCPSKTIFAVSANNNKPHSNVLLARNVFRFLVPCRFRLYRAAVAFPSMIVI